MARVITRYGSRPRLRSLRLHTALRISSLPSTGCRRQRLRKLDFWPRPTWPPSIRRGPVASKRDRRGYVTGYQLISSVRTARTWAGPAVGAAAALRRGARYDCCRYVACSVAGW